MIRSIPTDGGTAACDFDIRGTKFEETIARLDAIRATAAANLPVEAWFEASKAASGEENNLADFFAPPEVRLADVSGVEPTVSPWLWIGGAAAATGLAVWLLRK